QKLSHSYHSSNLLFFFQAEDGIRAFHVTGVQTCALPISSGSKSHGSTATSNTSAYWSAIRVCSTKRAKRTVARRTLWTRRSSSRSEERRVGKERTTQETPSPILKSPAILLIDSVGFTSNP